MEEQEGIEELARLERPGYLKIETTASFGQPGPYWATQSPDVLILKLPDDDLLQAYFFEKLRKDISPKQSLIVLCTTISAALMQLSTAYSKIRMIKTPVSGERLLQTIFEITQDYQEGKSQMHPRYLTDQSVELHSDFFEGKISAQMKNMSRSGAYFEIQHLDFELKPGDFLKLSIVSASASKEYVFDIRIVWKKLLDPGAQGFGVTFVDEEQVYNHLLRYF
jgi:hypothetical protein